MEKVFQSSRTTDISFFLFHLFLVGATNPSSALIHPLLKLPNCVLKEQPRILQLSEVLGLPVFSLFEEQALNKPFALRGHVTSVFMKMILPSKND